MKSLIKTIRKEIILAIGSLDHSKTKQIYSKMAVDKAYLDGIQHIFSLVEIYQELYRNKLEDVESDIVAARGYLPAPDDDSRAFLRSALRKLEELK